MKAKASHLVLVLVLALVGCEAIKNGSHDSLTGDGTYTAKNPTSLGSGLLRVTRSGGQVQGNNMYRRNTVDPYDQMSEKLAFTADGTGVVRIEQMVSLPQECPKGTAPTLEPTFVWATPDPRGTITTQVGVDQDFTVHFGQTYELWVTVLNKSFCGSMQYEFSTLYTYNQ